MTSTNALKLYVAQLLVTYPDPYPLCTTAPLRTIWMYGIWLSSVGNGTDPIDTPAGASHCAWLFVPMSIVIVAGLVSSAKPKTASAGYCALRGSVGVLQAAPFGCRRYQTTTWSVCGARAAVSGARRRAGTRGVDAL
jgi:hypothetical protein